MIGALWAMFLASDPMTNKKIAIAGLLDMLTVVAAVMVINPW